MVALRVKPQYCTNISFDLRSNHSLLNNDTLSSPFGCHFLLLVDQILLGETTPTKSMFYVYTGLKWWVVRKCWQRKMQFLLVELYQLHFSTGWQKQNALLKVIVDGQRQPVYFCRPTEGCAFQNAHTGTGLVCHVTVL